MTQETEERKGTYMAVADLIIKSKAVYTGKTIFPEEACVIIKDDKITGVCKPDELESYRGLDTQIYTFDDGMVLPGFIDAHTHILATAASQSVVRVDLTQSTSEQECIELIARHLEQHPELTGVVGNGWFLRKWNTEDLPDRKGLDARFPDIPIYLSSFDGHTCWLNGKALEVCGITKDTTVQFGEIQKYPNGEPTGILCDIAAISLVSKKTTMPSEESLLQNLQHFVSNGITSIVDVSADPVLNEEPAEYSPLMKLRDNRNLIARMHLYPSLGDSGNFALATELAEKYKYPDLKVAGLKQFIDGTTSAYSAALLSPYTDKPDEEGCVNYPEETYKKLVAEANKKGFSVKLHAIGDKAVRIALDAYEYAWDSGQRGTRNCVEHVENAQPSDVERFGKYHVIASMQPYHLVLDTNEKLIRLGTERARTVWPFRSLLDSGAILAFGSDFPVVDCNPLEAIYAAVERTFSDGSPATICQEERISLKEAIDACTQGGACSIGREHDLGTLEAGKLADIVVLDKNLFAIDAQEILKVKPVMTVMNGNIVYEMNMEENG